MTHMILESKFRYDVTREHDPWHKLGNPVNGKQDASETWADIGFSIQREPIFIQINQHMVQVPGQYALTGMLSGGPQVYGVVGNRYHLLDPSDAFRIFDQHVQEPIRTMGVLENGLVFTCVDMPSWALGSEEIQDKIILNLPFNGRDSLELWRSMFSPVCSNTLQASRASSHWQVKLRHTSDIVGEYTRALRNLLGLAEEGQKNIQQAFRYLIEVKPTEDQVVDAIKQIYPEPAIVEPKPYWSKDKKESKLEAYEKMLATTREFRSTTYDLFRRDMVGISLPTRHHTAWGLYNAVAELESHRNWGEGKRAAQSVLFGSRGETIARALDVCLTLK